MAAFALFVALVTWAVITPIGGAVLATGAVAVSGKPKSVQHLDGGIVQEILVADGDWVAVGDVILRLDDTLLVANLEIYLNRLGEAYVQAARLSAVAAGADRISFPPLPKLLAGRDLDATRAAETAIFASHLEVLEGRRAQNLEKIEQFGNQIAGVEALIAAKRERLGYVETDIARYQALKEKQLVRDSDLLSLQSTRADIVGQISEHISERARIENSIRDTELATAQLDSETREKAVTELRQVTTTMAELTQQVISTQKQLDRIDVRAPVAGHIHDMKAVTVGGVVPPGALIAQIVAEDASPGFELHVAPTGIDQVFAGQEVRLRFPAFAQSSTPEITGRVAYVSATTLVDEATGIAYYLVTAKVPDSERSRLGGQELVPGMPVEGFISTGARSAASYLMKPFTDQLERAFRED
ncbi:MAG: HlyD family type I secretion periplasmic adaptor subunit [Nitrospiraceae bacterium]|nr:HlyD family type I secretion periplasmic adaptor subunit [Nitrospiraceae bacterium]